MADAEKFIVVPFVERRKNLAIGEMRQSNSAASAERLALSMSSRFAGVAAYSVRVDTESGDMMDPKLIAQYGNTIDFLTQV